MKNLSKKLVILALIVATCFPAWPLIAQEPASPDPAQAAPEEALETPPEPATPDGEPAPEVDLAQESRVHEGIHRGIHRQAVVSIGKDVHIKTNEITQTVVVIGGSAKVDGHVEETVVTIGGHIEVNGEVGDAVVAVLGNVAAGPSAIIDGDVVSVGGSIDRAPGAKITGEMQQVDFGGIGIPQVEWLRDYLVHCILKLRPLAPQVGWAWGVAAVISLLYLLIAVLFPRPVQACVDELVNRPATTLLLGVLTKILAPVLIILLAATGIGLIVVPFIIAGLILFAVVGKIALLQAIGLQFGKQLNLQALRNPVPALLVGIFTILILYIIPVVGLIVFLGTSLWGLGCAVSAAFAGLRRELPPPRRPKTVLPEPTPSPVGSSQASSLPVAMSSFASTPLTSEGESNSPATAVETLEQPVSVPAPTLPPMMPEILAYPRAGFWERMGAGFLDMVLVLLASQLVGGLPLGFLVALAYFAGMWGWRQTTVGGIVLGLKVAREDGQDLSFPVALVRCLFAGFSILVLFLGFFWIAWDREKQGWHDKIAGTVVLKLPRSAPLVCL